jgi:nucleotide-binding universal stress UspA family protein
MKTILVATDFSPAADNAIKYASEMAVFLKADLALLHIFQIQISYNDSSAPVDVVAIQQSLEKEMDNLRNELQKKTNGKINITTNVREGAFFDELKSVCERYKPYIVVMGSQGTSATDRFFFGGHTIHAMKNLMWPLITVPPNSNFEPYKKIGLACDFDHVTDSIPVDEITRLVTDFDTKLLVLNTAKKKEFNPEMIYESGLVQEMLLDLKPVYHFITSPDVDEGIMNFAEKNDIDLLIVLPKHHTLPEKLMHKSHTKQLVLYSPIPVMALHQ